MDLTIKELIEKGHIEPSPSPYGAPILFVGKKDGSLRMVIDYRALNKLTVINRFPLPRIDDLMDRLQGAQYFSSLDLMSGYHQIRIGPEDELKTAFRTPFGHYQFKVLPFGLTNAPATFQSLINRVFGKYPFVVAYHDDILNYRNSREEHMQHLGMVLQTLPDSKLDAKLSKCSFLQTQVPFLGHLVGESGVQVDPAKTSAVQDWPVPMNVPQLRSYLGFAIYFRKFIQGYFNLVAPLNALLRKDVPFSWTSECQEAFEKVKQALMTAPVSAMPDPNEPFELVSHASGLGAVLLQHGQPVAFESKTMNLAERNYGPGEQELLATMHALRTWRCYLEGAAHPFTLVTDHAPHTFLQTQAVLSRRQARWSEFLERFNYKWQYRPGRGNVAGPLSRDALRLNRLNMLAHAGTKRSQKGDCHSDSDTAPGHAVFESASPSSSHVIGCCHDEGDAALNALNTRQTDMPVADDVPDQNDLAERIKAGYAQDEWFASKDNTAELLYADDYWWTSQGCIAVPDVDDLRQTIMQELHDSPYSGHMGTTKTLHAVRRMCWWPGMNQEIIGYVRDCMVCQRDKGKTKKPGGLLTPLQIPDKRWVQCLSEFHCATAYH